MLGKRIDDHTLQVLEFEQILALLGSYTRTDLGRESALALYPSTEPEWIRTRLAQTSELKALLDQDLRIPLAGIRNIRPLFKQLGGRQTLFEPQQLVDISETLTATARLKQFLSDLPESNYIQLCTLAKGLETFEFLTEQINHCIGSDEELRDTASEKLNHIRKRILRLEDEIRQRFQQLVSRRELRHALENSNFLLRHGRPVLAVKENYRSSIRGTVLDRSKSGATLYIEPDSLLEFSNALEDARFDEKKETDRILWELTHAVLSEDRSILRTVTQLAHIDVIAAKASFSVAYGMNAPAVGTKMPCCLREARHPLLMQMAGGESAEAHHQQVIPISMRLGDDFDLLLITGPNTGGKTVLLKTVGLCVLMAQTGMHIPAHADSSLPVYRQVFADIGDEQSIEQSLSTFSAHMSQMARILQRTNNQTLILLDELGAGTDPNEGAALGAAMLEHLLERGGHIVATSHLGQLKTFAYAHGRAENGSVEFDPVTLAPAYALAIGTPGTSNALVIAKRLGLPKAVLTQAEAWVEKQGHAVADLIAELQKSRTQTEERRAKAQGLLDRARETQEQAVDELQAMQDERQRLRQMADLEIESVLQHARKITNALRLQAQQAPLPWRDRMVEACDEIENLAQHSPLAERNRAFTDALRRGDTVYAIPFRSHGTVDRIRRKRKVATLLIHNKLMELRFDQICRPEIEGN